MRLRTPYEYELTSDKVYEIFSSPMLEKNYRAYTPLIPVFNVTLCEASGTHPSIECKWQ